MTTLLAFGTIGFWIVITVLIGIIIIFIEDMDERYPGNYDTRGTGMTVTLGITIALFYFLGLKEPLENLLQYIVHNGLILLLYAGGYLLIGVAFSFLKWYNLLLKIRDYYIKDGRTIKKSDLPSLGYHSASIICWMSYWPFFLIRFCASDFIRKIYLAIYMRFEQYYEKMVTRMFKDLIKEEK
jgi:hypothetical protein